jgi:GrpB-like predicted nucleotidyltransferase (UPF0157 family)
MQESLEQKPAQQNTSYFFQSIGNKLIPMMSTITVEDYSPQWAQNFEILKARIWPAVKAFAETIEHVGSTSVPGLAAKPIIDIDIIIPSRSELPAVVKALQSLGYEHLGTMGIADRDAFRIPNAKYRHNLYVCLAGSVALQNHMILRNKMRSNPKLRDEYSQLKKDLAQKFPNDIDQYIEGKTEFILNVLKQDGVGVESLESIRDANRAPRK